ncbi:hypothetical protein, partial [Klebsiella pneumoniae]
LHRAVQSGSLEAVERLLAAGADVDRRERKWRGSALSWALVLGKPRLVERLTPISHDVRALASLGSLERLAAVLDARPELANAVLPGDAPTPLFCLPDDEEDAVATARLLLARGADRRARNDKGDTAADAARKRGLDEAATLLGV